jgi:hypothetical protein
MLLATSYIISTTPVLAFALTPSFSSPTIPKRQIPIPVFPSASIKIFRTAHCAPLGGGPDRVQQRDNYANGTCSITPFFDPVQPLQKFYSIQATADVPRNVTCTLRMFAENVCTGTPNGQAGANECLDVPAGSVFYEWGCEETKIPAADVTVFAGEGCAETGGKVAYTGVAANTCQQPSEDRPFVLRSARAVSQLALPPGAVCRLLLFRARDCDPSSNYAGSVGGDGPGVCLSPTGLDVLPVRSFAWKCDFV